MGDRQETFCDAIRQKLAICSRQCRLSPRFPPGGVIAEEGQLFRSFDVSSRNPGFSDCFLPNPPTHLSLKNSARWKNRSSAGAFQKVVTNICGTYCIPWLGIAFDVSRTVHWKARAAPQNTFRDRIAYSAGRTVSCFSEKQTSVASSNE